ncbi:Hypothetical predicted protein [Octopus vulgaris]|uniref:Uncharacterized protein n=1 Tax=Octopus vulgaris TaxID=6645 RepID=A0AA36BBT8_OCTVU|nr:Hypothetical predicted protein [Octopus vulgaris]
MATPTGYEFQSNNTLRLQVAVSLISKEVCDIVLPDLYEDLNACLAEAPVERLGATLAEISFHQQLSYRK